MCLYIYGSIENLSDVPKDHIANQYQHKHLSQALRSLDLTHETVDRLSKLGKGRNKWRPDLLFI